MDKIEVDILKPGEVIEGLELIQQVYPHGFGAVFYVSDTDARAAMGFVVLGESGFADGLFLASLIMGTEGPMSDNTELVKRLIKARLISDCEVEVKFMTTDETPDPNFYSAEDFIALIVN